MIRFDCPKCGAKLKSPFGTEGRSSRCKCGQAIAVPGASAIEIPTATLLPEEPKASSTSYLSPTMPRATKSVESTAIEAEKSSAVSSFDFSRSRLETCPDCSHQVSRSAIECPNCGCPFTSPKSTTKVGPAGHASGVLALCSLALLFSLSSVPLIAAGTHTSAGITLAIAAIGAGTYEISTRRWSSGAVLGILAGVIAAAIWALVIVAIQDQWNSVREGFRRF